MRSKTIEFSIVFNAPLRQQVLKPPSRRRARRRTGTDSSGCGWNHRHRHRRRRRRTIDGKTCRRRCLRATPPRWQRFSCVIFRRRGFQELAPRRQLQLAAVGRVLCFILREAAACCGKARAGCYFKFNLPSVVVQWHAALAVPKPRSNTFRVPHDSD